MNDRIVKRSFIRGFFMLPMGLNLYRREAGSGSEFIEVSTVCLENGHLEDPLGICEPEHGYETMVFLDGCSFFSLYTAKYKTRRQALAGHRSAIKQLLAEKLPLAIELNHYCAHEEVPETAARAA